MRSLVLTLFALFSLNAFAGYTSLTVGEWSSLPDCGGRVRVTATPNGNGAYQVNIVLQRVEHCSKFQYTEVNGMRVDERVMNVGSGQMPRSASFTVPQRLMSSGYHNLEFVVRSNSGAHQDNVGVRFFNLGTPRRQRPTPTPPSYPAPAPSDPAEY